MKLLNEEIETMYSDYDFSGLIVNSLPNQVEYLLPIVPHVNFIFDDFFYRNEIDIPFNSSYYLRIIRSATAFLIDLFACDDNANFASVHIQSVEDWILKMVAIL